MSRRAKDYVPSPLLDQLRNYRQQQVTQRADFEDRMARMWAEESEYLNTKINECVWSMAASGTYVADIAKAYYGRDTQSRSEIYKIIDRKPNNFGLRNDGSATLVDPDRDARTLDRVNLTDYLWIEALSPAPGEYSRVQADDVPAGLWTFAGGEEVENPWSGHLDVEYDDVLGWTPSMTSLTRDGGTWSGNPLHSEWVKGTKTSKAALRAWLSEQIGD